MDMEVYVKIKLDYDNDETSSMVEEKMQEINI